MAFYLVIRGPLGVGKSTVSRRLGEILGTVPISIDRILEDHSLEEWVADRISLRSFLRANEYAAEAAISSLRQGRPAIIEGCFYWRKQIDDLVHRLSWPHHVFTLDAPFSECIARDATRPAPDPEVGPRGGDQQGPEGAKAVFEMVARVPAGIMIDASGSVDDTVAKILRSIPETSSPHASGAIER
jgi:predicted kinase